MRSPLHLHSVVRRSRFSSKSVLKGLTGLTGWLLLILVLFAIPGAGGCSNDDNCAEIQCINNVTLRLRVVQTAAQMQDSSIRVCRNGSCSEGKVDFLPTKAGEKQKVQISGKLTNDTTLAVAEPGKSFSVEAVIAIDDFEINADKDQYELRVLRGGIEIQGLAERAKYVETRPNGDDCPSVCVNATLGTP